jgi:2-keto-4-pentenoate hydratase/2-oxohepta-3-ene-1,7-dioic acid hydratase in catechol pathway
MRLVRFSAGGDPRIGAVVDGSVAELAGSWSDVLLHFSGGGEPAEPATTGRVWALTDCTLQAPLPDRARPIFCLGLNYIDHENEASEPLGVLRSGRPVVFTKQPESIADPGEELTLDTALSREFDWEVELAVVIGRGGRDIDEAQVVEHIAGYTVLNDVTARDAQREHLQWFLGKNVHRSSPVGPWVTTADEIAFPPDLRLTLSVNGVEKQRARTTELIFGVAEVVSIVSRYVELQPGDLFATGTPAGVGFTRTPPEFLSAGDLMVAEIEGIGRLQNRVVS